MSTAFHSGIDTSPSSSHQETTAIASHAGAEFFCENLRRLDPDIAESNSQILIAGCGAGHEAALIQQLLDAQVEAVDVENELRSEFANWQGLSYRTASVCELPFDENQFDAIFYHHVIEHVDRPMASLTELSRVLKPGGWIFVGTPNRHRVLSSVGAHKQTQWDPTWRNKINDNLRDWSARLRGKFRNEFGAHAGYSQGELSKMLNVDFARQRWCTQEYLNYKYSGHRFELGVQIISLRPFLGFSAPSIYVFAQNR